MQSYTVKRDGDRDLRFTGEIVAKATTRTASGPSSNRWQELTLYRSAAGKLVAEKIGRTLWEGEVDRFEAVVENDVAGTAGIVSFCGYSKAAKQLYEQAGIDAVERID